MAVIVISCGTPYVNKESNDTQGVFGVIQFQMRHDGSLIPRKKDPPPGPLPGATIYLLHYLTGDICRKDIIDSVVTDNTGAYQLKSPLGTYYLAVSKVGLNTIAVKGTPGGSVEFDVPINALSIIEILPGEYTKTSFTFEELTPQ